MTELDPGDVERLRAARQAVLDRMAAACARAGRSPDEVALVAVSKTFPPERLRAAVAAGLTTLGENRVQEAESKVGEVPGATWHLVGPLQKNKARRALEVFETIESVDSVALAERLDRIAAELRPAGRVPVLLQVNVDDDPSKAGFLPSDLEASLGSILDLSRLEVRGLMTIGRQVDRLEDARSTFVALRALSGRLRDRDARLGVQLSMGMTDDFEVAIEEGATIVRVGRALFGERPHHHDHDHGPGEDDHSHWHELPGRTPRGGAGRLGRVELRLGDRPTRSQQRWLLAEPDVRFAVRLTPRAGSDAVEGVVEGALKARVAAPAIGGAANQSLVRLLADELGIARRDVRIVAGAAGRQKLVVVEGVGEAAIIARWPGLKV